MTRALARPVASAGASRLPPLQAGGRGVPLRRRRFARVAARSQAWFGERGYALSSFQ
ncbi:hypothetical protein BDL_1053 [Burkholderia pseudomallei MSHR305]|nr:hypothetical protein BDL_1053 [Burkholderia pseudomallei MSHR305]AHK67046.1 hypothetical protein BBX_2997 [Burkholderia pseudomallei MSHR520]KGC68139.1 hypothetical protein DP57_1934 [Burkholderia pseudomallei]KGW91609.1 hypothetical protein Y048_3664 [Burkholderia pseudomallei MSHR456]